MDEKVVHCKDCVHLMLWREPDIMGKIGDCKLRLMHSTDSWYSAVKTDYFCGDGEVAQSGK